MTDEQINKRIAEACGWTSMKEDFECVLGRPPNTSDLYCRVPNYAGCLNAMHDAETREAIQRVGYAKYIECLAIACGTERLGALVFATAAQRAEAFLRTIGKWEDDK